MNPFAGRSEHRTSVGSRPLAAVARRAANGSNAATAAVQSLLFNGRVRPGAAVRLKKLASGKRSSADGSRFFDRSSNGLCLGTAEFGPHRRDCV